MNDFLWWLALSILLAIGEVLSGTFYLLLLSLGSAVGVIVALLGFGITAQITWVAMATLFGLLTLRFYKKKHPKLQTYLAHDMDQGNWVKVTSWQPNGTTKVNYRGSQWQAIADTDSPRTTGQYRIVRIDGITLIITAKEL